MARNSPNLSLINEVLTRGAQEQELKVVTRVVLQIGYSSGDQVCHSSPQSGYYGFPEFELGLWAETRGCKIIVKDLRHDTQQNTRTRQHSR